MGAIFVYQVTYYAWRRLEIEEIKDKKNSNAHENSQIDYGQANWRSGEVQALMHQLNDSRSGSKSVRD